MHLPIVLCCGTQRALFTNKITIRLVPNHPFYKVLCTYVFREGDIPVGNFARGILRAPLSSAIQWCV